MNPSRTLYGGIFWLNAPLIFLIAILLRLGRRGHSEPCGQPKGPNGIGLLASSLGLLLVASALLQKITLESAPTETAGSASGLYTLLRYLGTMGSSVALAAALLTGGSHAATLLFSLAVLAAAGSLAFAPAVRDRGTGKIRGA